MGCVSFEDPQEEQKLWVSALSVYSSRAGDAIAADVYAEHIIQSITQQEEGEESNEGLN